MLSCPSSLAPNIRLKTEHSKHDQPLVYASRWMIPFREPVFIPCLMTRQLVICEHCINSRVVKFCPAHVVVSTPEKTRDTLRLEQQYLRLTLTATSRVSGSID